jgi:hypothetical protein
MLRAGFTEIEITPPSTADLIGYEFRQQELPAGNAGVHDPLFARVLVLDDGTQNNRIGFQQQSSNQLRVFRTTAGTSTTATAATAVTVGTQLKIGVTVDGAGRVAASVDGGAAVAVTGAPTSGLTTLRIGNDVSGASPFFGEVRTLRVMPLALSDAELAARVARLPL